LIFEVKVKNKNKLKVRFLNNSNHLHEKKAYDKFLPQGTTNKTISINRHQRNLILEREIIRQQNRQIKTNLLKVDSDF